MSFFVIFFWFRIHTADATITSGMHTDGGAVIRKPGPEAPGSKALPQFMSYVCMHRGMCV